MSSGFAAGLPGPDFLHHAAWHRGVVVIAVAAFVLGVVGNGEYLDRHHGGATIGNSIYHTLQLYILHTPHFSGDVPWTLETARWLAPFSTLVGLLRLIALIFRGEAERLALHRCRGHAIVCGLGRRGLELVRHLSSDQRRRRAGIVVVDNDPGSDYSDECRRLGACYLAGDASKPEVLRAARVQQAASVYAVCTEDATNCEIAAQVVALAKASQEVGPDCYVHLGSAELGRSMQHALSGLLSQGGARVHVVDAYDPEAFELLVHGLPLDHDGVTETDQRTVRLVIMGFGRMGRAMAQRAAQLGAFANGKRLRIEIIDRHASFHRSAFLFHCPGIAAAAELAFHDAEAASLETRTLLEDFCSNPAFLTSIAICFEDEGLGLQVCLRSLIACPVENARVAVRMAHDSGLAHLVEGLKRREDESGAERCLSSPGDPVPARLASVRIFGTTQHLARLATLEEWPLERLARRIHENYVRLVTGSPPMAGHLRPECRLWHELSHDLRDSNRLQAAHIFIKLRSCGRQAVPKEDPRPENWDLSPEQLESLARLEHDRWCLERLVADWTYGEVKDIARRFNPNLVPWSSLSEDVKGFDREAVGRIPALLEMIEMKVVLAGTD